jgi:hypothetical protein
MAVSHEGCSFQDCSFQELHEEWENHLQQLQEKKIRTTDLDSWCWDNMFAGRLTSACRSHVQNGVWCDHGETLIELWDKENPGDENDGPGLKNLLDSSLRNVNEHQLRMVWAHLAITRRVASKNPSLDEALQWTSGTFLEEAIEEATGGLWDTPPFGPAFFRSLVRFLYSSPTLSADQFLASDDGERTSALFPVVLESGAGSAGNPTIARFRIHRLEEGTGNAFLHPSQAFLDMDEEFRSAFARAQRLVEGLSRDACVRIERWGEQKSFTDQTLAGPSAGGALYLGLRSLVEKEDLEGGLVASFGLGADPGGTPNGSCQPVGFIENKGSKLPQEGFRRFLVAEDQDAEGLEEHISDLEVLRAPTVGDAWEHATGRLAELRRYLRQVEKDAKEAAQFMSRDMPRVRARVRVSSERLSYDQVDRSDEQALLGSLQGREKLYEHRMGRSGSMERDEGPGREGEAQEKTYETLDWDEDIVGSGLKRGVILGDPGMGKTWLLHWEARRLAQEALDQLERSARPDEVQIPIRLRLYDVGKIMSEEDRSFEEAVIKCFSDKRIRRIRRPNESAKLPSESLINLIKQKTGTEGAWLLLDALDEVLNDEYRNALIADGGSSQGIKPFLGNNPDARVLVTSRTTRYDGAFSDVIRQDETEREMELLPFEDEQIEEFARGYFGEEEEAEGFLDELDDSAQIRGMAEVPLLLTFLCKIYESRKDSGFQSTNRAQVYEHIVNKILSATWHETERTSLSSSEQRTRVDEMSAMASTLLIQGELQFSQRKLDKAIQFGYSKNPVDEELTTSERRKEYTGKPGVLTQVGSDDDHVSLRSESPYLFVHLTIQEYLAARWIALQANENGWDHEIDTGDGRSFKISTIVDRKAWSPHWQQVILLLAGQLEDPVPLLELLADEERDDIFRNRLALAAHCLGEVMPQNN